MALNDFYKLVLRGVNGSVNTRNEFWYVQQAGTGGAEELLEAFDTEVKPTIQQLMLNTVFHVGIDVYNHNDDLDFIEFSFTPQAGALTGQPLPPFVALAFSTPRKRVGMRAGQKRFFGTPLGVTANGIVTNSSFITDALQTSTALSDLLVNTEASSSWQQIIVKRVNVGTPSNPDYRVPAIIPSDGYYVADSWTLKTQLSSQNTRKYGVGI